MKKILTSCFVLASMLAFAQPNSGNGVTPWRMGGNAAGTSDFLGTTNSQSLIFKSNNTTGMEIKPTGDIYFPTLGSTSGTMGLVVVGGDGHGGRIDILHNFSHVLNGQGIFTEISQLTGMKLSGNDILQTATGNIGIGTLTPTSKLSVVGDGSFTGDLYTGAITISNLSTGSSGLTEVYVDGNGNLKIAPGGNSGANQLLCSTSQNWNLGGNTIGSYMSGPYPPAAGTCDNFDFILKANNTNYVWLKPSGQVGIGTSSPSAMLDIATTGPRAFNIANAGTDLFSVNADGGTSIHLTNPQPQAAVLTMTHANGSAFKILANGTGDITSSSSFSAHFGTGALDNFAIYQGVPGSGIQHFYMAGGTGSSYFRTTDATANGTAFMIVNNPSTNGTGQDKTVVMVKNDGSTGINNAAPYKMLTVNGDVSFANYNTSGTGNQSDGFSGLEILGTGNGTTSGAVKIPTRRGITTDFDPDGDFNFYINSNQTSSEFNFLNGNGNAKLFSISSNGQASIYTNSNSGSSTYSPNALVVKDINTGAVNFLVKTAGQVYVREVIVTNNTFPFPDYVFKKNYKLTPLLDVDKYISEHGNLKNMPTAEQVAREGANIGEIQRVSVEKIEEHTLYLIEIKKELIELKKEIEDLKNENTDLKKELKKFKN